MKWLAAAAGGYSAALLALDAVHLLAPQRDGLAAISQVFAPHLHLPLLVIVPVALAARARGPVLAAVLLAAAVALLRFGPGMVSLPTPPTADETTIPVLAWNLAAGEASPDVLVERLLGSDAELVALPELQPAHVAEIERSPELSARFAHRLLRAHETVLGMGLLSAHPLAERSSATDPPHMLADVELPGGQTLVALAAHPLPARFSLVGGLLPIAYRAAERDRALAELRALVEPDLAAGRPVLLLGDFNVTDREPAYAALTAGLADAHRQAGFGPGSTWRPPQLDGMPLGILRIDYVFTAGPLRATSSSVDCLPDAGDHCIVRATLALADR